jgi:hypothetical protein
MATIKKPGWGEGAGLLRDWKSKHLRRNGLVGNIGES